MAVNTELLTKQAEALRLQTLQMIRDARSSHVGTNFSMVELLLVLYTEILNISPDTLDDPNRDRFILSKGHGCAVLYAVLAQEGFFPTDWLETFYHNGSQLAGHATSHVPGVELSTGSLGHGLSVGTGMALAAKIDKKSYRVFVLLSDGEMDEGSNWEPILFAPQHQLDNLVVIVDYNKIQSLGTVADVINLEPFVDKWTACGWDVVEVDGHNIEQIHDALQHIPTTPNKPTVVVAHTIKGKGVDFMEDKLLWHYRSPQGDEYERACEQLANS